MPMVSPLRKLPCMAVVSKSHVTDSTPLTRSCIAADVLKTSSQRLEDWPKTWPGNSPQRRLNKIANDPPPLRSFGEASEWRMAPAHPLGRSVVSFLHAAFFIL